MPDDTNKGNQVNAADARTFLTDFVSDPQNLQTMGDEDVVKLHGKVSASIAKHAPKPAERNAPDTYDLKAPKDSPFDGEASARGAAKFKELKLTNEEAQAAFEYADSEVRAFQTRAAAEWEKRVDGWGEAAKSDKEIGGANYDKATKLATAVVKKFGTPELMEELNRGYGNHPELVRLLSRVAVHFDEATLFPPSEGAGGNKQVSAADALYGGTKSQ